MRALKIIIGVALAKEIEFPGRYPWTITRSVGPLSPTAELPSADRMVSGSRRKGSPCYLGGSFDVDLCSATCNAVNVGRQAMKKVLFGNDSVVYQVFGTELSFQIICSTHCWQAASIRTVRTSDLRTPSGQEAPNFDGS